MDLIAQRGIASHYSGRGFVTGFVGRTIPYGRSSRGKTVCLNNANIALRVLYLYSLLVFDSLLVVLGGSSWQTPFVSHDFDSNFLDLLFPPDWLAQCNQRMARGICWQHELSRICRNYNQRSIRQSCVCVYAKGRGKKLDCFIIGIVVIFNWIRT